VSDSPSTRGTVAVIGAGSWGTALAEHVARRGYAVRLWSRTESHARELASKRENVRYLPGFRLHDRVEVTHDRSRAIELAQLVIWAVPSHATRDVIRAFRGPLERAKVDPRRDVMGAEIDAPRLSLVAAKGVEVDTLATMAEVLADELPEHERKHVSVLGGPSFAVEVAEGLPTAVVVGSCVPNDGVAIQEILSGDGVRAYATEDVVGVELGGAFKNVIALAAGVVDGAGLGLNARAGLITRGLAEISRLSIQMGAHPSTLAGLAGLGDLVLTCTGGPSRNRRVGLYLVQGKSLTEILAQLGSRGMVAEGVMNTKSAHQLATRERVEMPIVAAMHAILYEGLTVTHAVEALMTRALKPERA